MTQHAPAWQPDKLLDDAGRAHEGYANINMLHDTRYLAEWYEGTFMLFEPGAWKTFDIGSVVSAPSTYYQSTPIYIEMHVYQIRVLEDRTAELFIRSAGKPTR